MLIRVEVTSRLSWSQMICLWACSVSHGLLDLRSQFHTGSWPEAFIFLTYGLLCRAEPNREGSLLLAKREQEIVTQERFVVIYNQSWKYHPITSVILFIRSKSQNPTQRKLYKGMNTRKWGSFGGHLGDCLPHKNASDTVQGDEMAGPETFTGFS